ncbi:MAG: hypothetical protein JNM99_08595 [Verrucomicrobiaceae bacterium]|nr:hypothetical protein [Verrucomicrobiaceae bacterium]
MPSRCNLALVTSANHDVAPHRWPFWLLAGLVILAALWVAVGDGHTLHERRSQAALWAGGAIASAIMLMSSRLHGERWQRWIVRGLSAGALIFGLPELVAQRTGIAWDVRLGVTAPESECPVFYRMPTRVLDGLYLQREGGLSWSGKPLSALMKWKRCSDEAYAGEQAFDSHYDRDGFRNLADLRDWDVVVVGDSQVELASLPEEKSITGVLAKQSGLRVKNLGTAGTGMLTHLAYLRHFGRAESCRDAILFLNEHDLTELADEWSRVQAHQPPPQGVQNHSLLLAAWRRLGQTMRSSEGRSFLNAELKGPEGRVVPVSFYPPVSHGSDRMTALERQALAEAMSQFAELAHQLHMRAWLVLEPSALRVWHGRLAFRAEASAEVRGWQPNDAMEVMRRAAEAAGVDVIDLAPPLSAAVDRGLLFNPILDKHLTSLGAEVVADTIAAALAKSKPKP